MANVYVGSGGSDANNGLTWATRKLTLNGCEDIPLSAGDTVWVAPGVYRETLTCDVSGSSGSPITYVADITGENTDGVGGVVRLTGSNNDQTPTRANSITGTSRNYRTFRGFMFDTHTNNNYAIVNAGGTNWIIEDCFFETTRGITINGATQANCTIRRCVIHNAHQGNTAQGILITHSATVNNAGHLIENCVIHGGGVNSVGAVNDRVGGVTIRNCTFMDIQVGCRVQTALAAGQTMTVNNCILQGHSAAFMATATGELVEDYNSVYGASTARTNVLTGANSNAYPALLNPFMLVSGYRRPQFPPFSLSEWSALRAIAGTGEPTDDFQGITRPATSAKKSWGAVQSNELGRETTTVRTGTASLRLSDAGRHQMFVPTTAVSTTISVYTRWEANYAGTKPQMVIKQPGQSDITVTATGSAGAWELLTHTFTPAAAPGYVVVELVSSNSATSGSYSVYFDDLEVS